jgi:hypothetical protein
VIFVITVAKPAQNEKAEHDDETELDRAKESKEKATVVILPLEKDEIGRVLRDNFATPVKSVASGFGQLPVQAAQEELAAY